MTPTRYSMAEAARVAGVAKNTIRNRINKGDLSAERQEDGSYLIDAAELARVFDLVMIGGQLQPKAPAQVTSDAPQGTGGAAPGAELGILPLERLELERLRERTAAQAAMIEQLTADRDRLAETIAHERRLLAAPKEPEAAPAPANDARPPVQRRSIFARLTGKQ